MTETAKLKPCPFCGSDKLKNILSGYASQGNGWKVWCSGCENSQSGFYATLLNAQESWNTRPLESELLAALEEVTLQLERLVYDGDPEPACITTANALIAKHREGSQ